MSVFTMTFYDYVCLGPLRRVYRTGLDPALPALSCVTLGKPITSLRVNYLSHETRMRLRQQTHWTYEAKIKHVKMLCELQIVIQCQLFLITVTYAVAQTRQIFNKKSLQTRLRRRGNRKRSLFLQREEPQHSLLIQPQDGYSLYQGVLSHKHNPVI